MDRISYGLGGLFQKSPWVAEQAYGARPFSGIDPRKAFR
jgi:2-oxo-4-hydroxy-4-carboxy--5-ureidoimidazoline (OHCU) decarboxylase